MFGGGGEVAMRRRWRSVAAATLLAAGLAALLLVWRPWQPPRSFVTADELGYVIEYEIDPQTAHMHGSNPDRAGEEFVSVVVQGHYSMQIVDGRVTVKQTRRGDVNKGDRLKITLDGRLWVNGTERRP
jgi:hypothetical protein